MDDVNGPTLGEMVERMSAGGGRVAAHVSPSWMQGRTAFGGVTAALALAAVRRSLPDLPALRSAQLSYIRPVSEEVVFEVDLIRAGRSSSFVQVGCVSEGALGAQALFVFGAARDSRHSHDRSDLPALPDPVDCPEFARPGQGPGFLSNFDMKLADGDPLISGSDRPEYTVWSRLRRSEGVPAEIALMCIADSLPPAAMTGFVQRAPISTMTWGIDFARIPETCGWVRVATRSRHAADGYSVQVMELGDAEGRMLASARQLVALFD